MISKSDYMLFLKHPAWLWIKKNDPSKLPPVDDNMQAMFVKILPTSVRHYYQPYGSVFLL